MPLRNNSKNATIIIITPSHKKIVIEDCDNEDVAIWDTLVLLYSYLEAIFTAAYLSLAHDKEMPITFRGVNSDNEDL